MQPPTADMRASARADPPSVGPARRQPSWAGVRLHSPYPAAGAARAAAAPLGPAPTGPVGVWSLPAPVAGARPPHMPFAFHYPRMPCPTHYSGGAAAPPTPQPPDLAAGRADDFVASGARGAAAPAASAAPAAAPAPAAGQKPRCGKERVSCTLARLREALTTLAVAAAHGAKLNYSGAGASFTGHASGGAVGLFSINYFRQNGWAFLKGE